MKSGFYIKIHEVLAKKKKKKKKKKDATVGLFSLISLMEFITVTLTHLLLDIQTS